MSFFSAMSIANQALLANKDALSVRSRNLSNAFTEGYNRRIPVMSNFPSGDVALDRVERAFDEKFFKRYIKANNQEQFYENYRDMLKEIETVFNDANGTGFSKEIDEFFQSLNDVAANPDDLVARNSVVSKANQLVGRIRNSYENLRDIKERYNETIRRDITEINNIARQLAEINKSLSDSEFSDVRKNAYLDERDRLIKKLSQYIDIQFVIHKNNTVDITTVKGIPLVRGNNYEKLKFERDENGNPVIRARNSDITRYIQNGQIGGYLKGIKFLNETINNLNDFTATFALITNKVHSQGYDLNGNPGKNFFSIDPESSKTNIDASNIVVNIQKPEELAAAKDPANLNGDNSNIKRLIDIKDKIDGILSSTEESNLKTTGLSFNGIDYKLSNSDSYSTIKSETFHGFYSGNLISKIGFEIEDTEDMYQHVKTTLETIDAKLKEKTGVNVDEELVYLLQLQKAYEAAAKVISVTDELLDVLIKMA